MKINQLLWQLSMGATLRIARPNGVYAFLSHTLEGTNIHIYSRSLEDAFAEDWEESKE